MVKKGFEYVFFWLIGLLVNLIFLPDLTRSILLLFLLEPDSAEYMDYESKCLVEIAIFILDSFVLLIFFFDFIF